jgi:hypothetical protein
MNNQNATQRLESAATLVLFVKLALIAMRSLLLRKWGWKQRSSMFETMVRS